ncbi:MAG: hypothetical protein JWM77_4275 [Rhodospirillales bacterium]|nr:hypothetical protein [Rhodospirillales bacterium]
MVIRLLAVSFALSLAAPLAVAQDAATAIDKYRWLEEQRAPAAIAWAKERRDRAVANLSAKPLFPTLERELRDSLAASAPRPPTFLLGDHFVRLTRDAAHSSGLLQVAPKRAGRAPSGWRTVLDVGELNRREGASYVLSGLSMFDFPSRCLPPDFNRCLLALSPGGSSSLELREFDLRKGDFVEGGFRTRPNRSFTAWLNQDTLLIAHSLDGSPALPSNFPAALYLWKRGTNLVDAKKLYEAPPSTSLVEAFALGAGVQRRGVLTIIHDYSTIEYRLIDSGGTLSKIDLPQKLKYVGRPALRYPYISVQLAAPATIEGEAYAAETIVAYDVRADVPSHVSAVFVPDRGTYVSDGIDGTGDSIVFVEDNNLRKTLMRATPTTKGWSVRKLQSAPPGVALNVIKPDGVSSELLVERKGFLTPSTLDLLAPGKKPVEIEAGKQIFEARDFTVEVRAAKSKDGTLVDYYLVRPKYPAPGPVPTVMSGYGSFGLNFSPDYFSSGLGRGMVSWLARGGAYAATAIRGGGERGDAWRLAGTGLNKQNSFDDFAAVAEDLIASGFTAPNRLGAFGRSGGGLLTAAMVTQHPDLFGAIFVGVPVTDVGALSTSGSGIIKGQKTEFGDWDDPKILPTILSWSPYQNIRTGLPYPRILVMTSTEDNQVGPGQARKFVAKLEEVGAKPLLIEEAQGGHSVPDSIKQPELVAAEMMFFIDALMPDRTK